MNRLLVLGAALLPWAATASPAQDRFGLPNPFRSDEEFATLASTEEVLQHADPEIASWSRLAVAGRNQELLGILETELSRETPHRHATWMWLRTQERLDGNLIEAAAALPEPARSRVTDLAMVRTARVEGRVVEAYRWLPKEQLAEVTDLALLARLYWCADECADREVAFDLLLRTLELTPRSLYSVWNAYHFLDTADQYRQRLLAAVAPGSALGETPAGRRTFQLATDGPNRDAFLDLYNTYQVRLCRDWLREHPGDWAAHAWLGTLLNTQNHRAEGLRHLLSASWLGPFHPYALRSATNLVKAGRETEAKEVLETLSRTLFKQLEWAEALSGGGAPGPARTILDGLLQADPDDVDALKIYIEIETASGRSNQALELTARAVKLRPDDPWFLNARVEALYRAGLNEKALRTWDFATLDLATANPEHLRSLVDTTADVLVALDRRDEAIALFERATKAWPGSRWMITNLAQQLVAADRLPEALTLTDLALTMEPDNAWVVRRRFEWTEQHSSLTEAQRWIASFRNAQPLCESVWDISSIKAKSHDDRLAIWNEAIQKTGGRLWAYDGLSLAYEKNRDWDRMVSAVWDAPRSDVWKVFMPRRIAARLHKAREAGRQFTADEATSILSLMDGALAGGGEAGDTYWWKGRIATALGKTDVAAQAMIDCCRADPNQVGKVATMRQAAGEVSGGLHNRMLHELLRRDPFDTGRLNRVSHRFARWSGSPVEVVRIADHFRAALPDEFRDSRCQRELNTVMGNAGDPRRSFEQSYSRARLIGASERFIGWYESSRREALTAGPAKIVFDVAAGTVSTTLEDGSVRVKGYHPITGKITYVGNGGAWIRARYTSDGEQLVAFEASDGRKVQLSYVGEHIDTVKDSTGTTLTFEYDDRGKPTKISVAGVGALVVVYDQDGEVTSTNGVTPDGKEGGHTIALQVNRSMQELLSMARRVEGGALDGLLPRDRRAEELQQVYQDADSVETRIKALLALGQHMLEERGRAPDHLTRSGDALTYLVREILSDDPAAHAEVLGSAVLALQKQKRLANPFGIDLEEMQAWTALRDRLRDLSTENTQTINAALRAMDESPITLADAARWLPDSALDNQSWWSAWSLRENLAKDQSANLRLHTVHVRDNGHILVGTNMGLFIKASGWWQRYVVDEGRNGLRPAAPGEAVRAASDIQAIEATDGALWLGTANGLVRLDMAGDTAEYGGNATRWVTAQDGLPSPAVLHVASVGNDVHVATTRGMIRINGDGMSAIPAPSDQRVLGLRSIATRGTGGSAQRMLFVLHEKGYGIIHPERGYSHVADTRIDDLVQSPETGAAFALQHNTVHAVHVGADGALQLRPLPGQQDILRRDETFGLTFLPIETEGTWQLALAVQTDRGVSIFHESHFEAVKLAGGVRDVGVRSVAALWSGDSDAPASWFALTTDEVRAFDRRAVIHAEGRVHDIQVADPWGLTFVAKETRFGRSAIWAFDHKNERLVPFVSADATHLALDAKGRLIANDGYEVIRFDVNSTSWETLFTANPKQLADEFRDQVGRIKSLAVQADGTIWAVAGGSIFRWREGSGATEFGYAVDRTKFPTPSSTLHGVLESRSGDILVTASKEKHLEHEGISLRGGLLRYDAEKEVFEPLLDDKFNASSSAFFITAYTELPDGQAVLGTLDDFFLIDTEGRFVELLETNKSYRALYDESPRLWMGTEGVQLGQETWLFGCARGLVCMRGNVWFSPDRLNGMLPDHARSLYGSTHVYDVAYDKAGRLYVGTVQGLMIHTGGIDATRLMMDEGMAAQATVDAEQLKLRRQAEVLLRGLEEQDSPSATRLRRLLQNRQRIEALTRRKQAGTQFLTPQSGEAGPIGRKSVSNREVDRMLRRERANYDRALRQIRFSDPVLVQLLEVEPLDLAATQDEIPEGVVVLQTIPSAKRLYLNVLSRDSAKVVHVDVSREELDKRCREASSLFRRSVRDLDRGDGIDPDDPEPDEDQRDKRRKRLREHLAWIYEHAVRPVEGDLEGFRCVMVSPGGSLSQIPPAAWLRVEGDDQQFLAQRFPAIGLLTDLHKIRLGSTTLMLGHEEALIMGDPGGDLVGARAEAKRVHKLLDARRDLLLGSSADFDSILREGEGASLLHFATHGTIDVKNPVASHLQLGGNRNMMIYDICAMPFKDADFAVLSACESGVGANGQAYGSLASAFLNAGVPVTVATLWKVSDQWSRELMEAFYESYVGGMPPHEALNAAQRKMLKKHGDKLSPSAWAGYVAFGLPF